MSKRVFSFSLYGHDEAYMHAALRIASETKEKFPGYLPRFYVSQEIDEGLVTQLQDIGSEIIRKERKHDGIEGMYWRFLAANDPEVEMAMIRDIDTLFTIRDQQVQKEWLESNKDYHIVRDNPKFLSIEVPGCFWSCRGRKIPQIGAMIEDWCTDRFAYSFGADQDFLAHRVYPKMRHSLYVHTSYVAYIGERYHPTPPHHPDIIPNCLGAKETEPIQDPWQLRRMYKRRYVWRVPVYMRKRLPMRIARALQRGADDYLFFWTKCLAAYIVVLREETLPRLLKRKSST